MATYFARAAGNINATNVWATTPAGVAGDYFGSFTASDVLMSNNFIIQVNVGFTVDSIRNTNFDGATAGGQFQLAASGLTINADLIAGASNLLINSTASRSLTINGDITAGTAAGLNWSGAAGTITIVGNITGGSGSGINGFACNGANSVVNVTGNLTGGSAATSHAMLVNVASATGMTITINGDLIAGSSTGAGLNVTASSTNVTLTIIGNITGGSNNTSYGAAIASIGGNTTVTGNISGHSSSSGNGLNYSATGSLTVNGNCKGGDGNSASVGLNITGTSGLTITLVRAIGGTGIGGGPGVSCVSTRVCYLQEIEYGDLGASPTTGPIRLNDQTTNVALIHRYLDTKKTLVDAFTVSPVDEGDVRLGVSYNEGAYTGTMIVPPQESVLVNVPVDNVLGTLGISANDFWDTAISSLTTAGSIGERLKNCATIESVGQQLSQTINGV